MPPESVTTAAARISAGIHSGDVVGATSTSPSSRSGASTGARSTRTGPRAVPADAPVPASTASGSSRVGAPPLIGIDPPDPGVADPGAVAGRPVIGRDCTIQIDPSDPIVHSTSWGVPKWSSMLRPSSLRAATSAWDRTGAEVADGSPSPLGRVASTMIPLVRSTSNRSGSEPPDTTDPPAPTASITRRSTAARGSTVNMTPDRCDGAMRWTITAIAGSDAPDGCRAMPAR